LVSVAAIKETDWYALVLYPEARFSDSLRALYLGLALMTLGAAFVGILLSRLRFRRIGRALAAISTEADRISRGDYAHLEEFGEGFAEFQRIGESLNGMIRGVSGREEVLMHRERAFREILERIELPALSVDTEGRILFANSWMLGLTGYGEDELMGHNLELFLPKDRKLDDCPFMRLLRGELLPRANRCEWTMKGGRRRIIEWSLASNLDQEGALAGVTGIGHDITEEVRQRARIEQALHEKEILLKEVHHRVKNNLQIVTSLLFLQSSESDDERVRAGLAVATERILSMARIHERLYGSEDFTEIDMGEYARDLAADILGEMAGPMPELRCRLELLPLSLVQAIPCGLIVNEALANIRKHAFPEGWSGPQAVELEVGVNEAGIARIAIRDNGRGLPECFDPAMSGSLGMEIMRMLSSQLGGRFGISSAQQGTLVEVVFTPKASTSGELLPDA
jgi:PAS domain S-box-containing protein